MVNGGLLFCPFAAALFDCRQLPPAGPFYLRRPVRIGPPYLACLGLFTASWYAAGNNPPTAGNVWGRVIAEARGNPSPENQNTFKWGMALPGDIKASC